MPTLFKTGEKMLKNNKSKLKIAIIIIIFDIILVSSILGIMYIKGAFNKEENIVQDTSIIDIEIPEESPKRIEEVKKLKEENGDIVGWLEIEGTNINYPVLQCTDNEYYMTHTYKKEYSKDGSLFLDTEYDWTIPSSNLLIYGHNNLNGNMFNDLEKFKEESFYLEHPTFKFTTVDEDCEYEIIAVFLSRVYYKSEKNVFRYYYFINAKNQSEFENYVNNSKKASLYDTGKTAKYGDQLMTLSTCSYHTTDGRLAVVAKKINK